MAGRARAMMAAEVITKVFIAFSPFWFVSEVG
jgi:hypothetical protein